MNEEVFLNQDHEKLFLQLKEGNVGLALSGGGFRASFFHIGVLRKLAELNLLRHIKCLSMVSGGTVVGVLYYLLLKEKLSQKSHLSRDEYIQIVERLTEVFTDGVNADIRNKVYLNPIKELQFTLSFSFYSRTHYLGEIYEKYFYQHFRTELNKPILLRDLRPFIKTSDNQEIEIKGLPKLIINATNLDNGRNHFFSPECMGNYMGYGQKIIESNEGIRLCDAVAASTAVPGIFPPIRIKKIDKKSLRLIDGGVFDNLGINALYIENCTHYLVSDGSKQLIGNKDVKTDIVSMGFRSTDISMEASKSILLDRVSNEHSLYHMHLRYGLDQSVNRTSRELPIDGEIQDILSQLRTDLNKFSTMESMALQYIGYQVVEANFPFSVNYNTRLQNISATGPIREMIIGSNRIKYDLEKGQKRIIRVNRFYYLPDDWTKPTELARLLISAFQIHFSLLFGFAMFISTIFFTFKTLKYLYDHNLLEKKMSIPVTDFLFYSSITAICISTLVILIPGLNALPLFSWLIRLLFSIVFFAISLPVIVFILSYRAFCHLKQNKLGLRVFQ